MHELSPILRRIGLVLALLLSMALLSPLAARTVGAAGAPNLVTNVAPSPEGQLAPRTDGKAVVWAQENENDPSQSHIWAARIGTTVTVQLATGPAVRSNPDIDQGIAVWSTGGTDCTTCGQQIVGKEPRYRPVFFGFGSG